MLLPNQGKSGLFKDLASLNEDFDDYKIDTIPVIQEVLNLEQNESEYPSALRLNMRYLSLRLNVIDPHHENPEQPIYLFGPTASYLFLARGLCYLHSSNQYEYSANIGVKMSDDSTIQNSQDSVTLETWDEKLERCYNLFTYAWAIADDGCTIEKSGNKDGNWKIRRRYDDASRVPSLSLHADSVIDLYPLRITEIADLGRVFAAVCASLRYFTSSDSAMRKREVEWLLLNISAIKGLDSTASSALAEQSRYNGYLKPYFDKCSVIIRKMLDKRCSDVTQLETEKDQLLAAIFRLDGMKS